MGCYPSGGIWAAFDDGLNRTMVSTIAGTSEIDRLLNGYYMFGLKSGMTKESCAKICFENSFLFSAIGGLGSFLICLKII
jgi:hypothetical protein